MKFNGTWVDYYSYKSYMSIDIFPSSVAITSHYMMNSMWHLSVLLVSGSIHISILIICSWGCFLKIIIFAEEPSTISSHPAKAMEVCVNNFSFLYCINTQALRRISLSLPVIESAHFLIQALHIDDLSLLYSTEYSIYSAQVNQYSIAWILYSMVTQWQYFFREYRVYSVDQSVIYAVNSPWHGYKHTSNNVFFFHDGLQHIRQTNQ